MKSSGKIQAILFIILTAISLSSCRQTQTKHASAISGDTLTLKYAKLLTLVKYDSFQVVTIRNPWNPEYILNRYILIEKGKELPEDTPEGTRIFVPLENAVVYSSVHYSLLNLLGATGSIDGVCDAEFIMNPNARLQLKDGTLTDYGNSMNPNIELLLDRHPDALMPSPYEQNGGYGKLARLNIPIIECADYMEHSALGRAEWMKFYGLLFGKAQQADSLFKHVESRYLQLKKMAENTPHKPSLLCEIKTGADWFIPGGESTSGQLYQDAGANYLFADRKTNKTLSLSFETVLEKAGMADIWLIKYNQSSDLTYRQMQQDYSPYTRFKAWQKRNIYGCNTRYIPFYEETPFQPHLLLQDLIALIHPELLPQVKNRYFTPIK